MIIDIKKAILHILDCNSGAGIFSEEEIDLTDNMAPAYFSNHIERVYQDAGLRKGEFTESSGFKYHLKEYIDGDITFQNFSLFVAERLYENIKSSDDLESCDIVLCDAVIGERKIMAVLKFDNKIGFVHQVSNVDGKIKTEIMNHYAILPPITNKITNCAFVDMEDFSIRYKGKKITIDGEKVDLMADACLECIFDMSVRESYNAVRKIAKNVSAEYGASEIETEARMKKYVKESAVKAEEINVEDAAEEMFSGLVSAKHDFCEKLKEANVPEKIEMTPYIAKRVNANIRLITDTGVEILFPSEYYKDDENISIINNDDGTISVQINNINKLTNK